MRNSSPPKSIDFDGVFFLYFNKTEMSAVESWIEKHIEEKHGGNTYARAIGGRFSYVFVPTSLGVIGTIRCGCGEEYCFRDIF